MWLHHFWGRNDLFTKFDPASVSSTHATIQRAFAWVPINIRMRYVIRRKKKPMSCGSPLNAKAMAYGTFDGGLGVFVAKVLQGALSILYSFRESVGSCVFVVSATTFVITTVVDFLRSASSEGQFRFSQGPVHFRSMFSFSMGA